MSRTVPQAEQAERTETTDAGRPVYVRAAAVVATSSESDYRVDIRAGRHPLAADEPESVGGADTAPTPVGLLLSALGSCTVITLRMYAQRKQWPLPEVRVHLAYEKGPDRAARITRRIELTGDLDDARRARLLEIADRTPVTRAVRGEVPIVPAPERPGRHNSVPRPAATEGTQSS
ncbi:OsmC family protein [Streptomyces sp. NPDC060366]|uniref:OsmC family protein n=1 Tax=Streptomyces sp. NPDC060366 TaxID=3347105 RepID=UPI00365FECA9